MNLNKATKKLSKEQEEIFSTLSNNFPDLESVLDSSIFFSPKPLAVQKILFALFIEFSPNFYTKETFIRSTLASIQDEDPRLLELLTNGILQFIKLKSTINMIRDTFKEQSFSPSDFVEPDGKTTTKILKRFVQLMYFRERFMDVYEESKSENEKKVEILEEYRSELKKKEEKLASLKAAVAAEKSSLDSSTKTLESEQKQNKYLKEAKKSFSEKVNLRNLQLKEVKRKGQLEKEKKERVQKIINTINLMQEAKTTSKEEFISLLQKDKKEILEKNSKIGFELTNFKEVYNENRKYVESMRSRFMQIYNLRVDLENLYYAKKTIEELGEKERKVIQDFRNMEKEIEEAQRLIKEKKADMKTIVEDLLKRKEIKEVEETNKRVEVVNLKNKKRVGQEEKKELEKDLENLVKLKEGLNRELEKHSGGLESILDRLADEIEKFSKSVCV